MIHLAAQAGVRHSIQNPHIYVQSNLVGQVNLLEFFRHHDGFEAMVYASSSSVYGGNTKMPFSEDDRVDTPVSLYAATKKADELISHVYAHLYGMKLIGLRFFTVYGPWGRPDMAMWLFTRAILAGEPIPVFNHGRMKRDFTFVDDIVRGVLMVAKEPDRAFSGAPTHRVYNIGNNRPEDLMHMISVLEGVLGRTAQKQMLPLQPGGRAGELRRHRRHPPRLRLRADDADREGHSGLRRLVSLLSRARSRGIAGLKRVGARGSSAPRPPGLRVRRAGALQEPSRPRRRARRRGARAAALARPDGASRRRTGRRCTNRRPPIARPIPATAR